MSRFDRFSLLAVTAVAALLRLPGIDARGRFDADQGHDMLTLMAFTRNGVWPLLGPKTSVGDFHHGAFYYYLLAPAAALSNDNPVVVTAWIALLGIGAVVLTWWLARSIGGPLAGALAGMLLAISPAAIDESTFIWNPNPIAFFAVLALGAAWHAHRNAAVLPRGRVAAWWSLAIGAAGAVMELHILGIVFLAAIGVLALIEVRRTRAALLGVAGGAGLVLLLLLPLLVHELQNDWLETRLMVAYLFGGAGSPNGGPALALAFTLFRIVGWPLVGLVTDVPAATGVLVAIVIGLIGIWDLRARGDERTAMWWLVGILAWSTVALAFAAPSLQTVVAGLPNDHYHAFVDPIVVILIAVPTASLFQSALAAWRARRTTPRAAAPALIGIAVVVLAVGMLSRKPPAVDPDGGWPALQAAGQRVASQVGTAVVVVEGVPTFKLPAALEFPVAYAGGHTRGFFMQAIGYFAVACDRLFEDAIHQQCGGQAEDALLQSQDLAADLIDRFDASPRTVVSLYRPRS
ncbi:MAG TPA: phospholipid carrier-dependent glycosyltransferase [Candidatus Limnocylindrales bacterium]|nr:phospholipid carrier-dependent glycosyltransferase [Candidatus Limnocylindrales bacterium]